MSRDSARERAMHILSGASDNLAASRRWEIDEVVEEAIEVGEEAKVEEIGTEEPHQEVVAARLAATVQVAVEAAQSLGEPRCPLFVEPAPNNANKYKQPRGADQQVGNPTFELLLLLSFMCCKMSVSRGFTFVVLQVPKYVLLSI